MKEKELFWSILITLLLLVLGFWGFAYFLTENKPIHVPLFATFDFKNHWLLLPIIGLNYYLLIKMLLKKKIKLTMICLLGFSLIILINSLKLNFTIASPLNDPNDYYVDALKITDLKKFLSSFHRRTFFHQLHTRTHPPGPVLFHFFINQLSSQQTIVNALLMILISSLNILLVYKISGFFKIRKKNFNFILLLSSPGILLFSATCMDAIYAFLISASIYSLLLLTKKFSLRNMIISIIWIFLATFFTYASIIIPLFSLSYILFNKFKNQKYILSQILTLIIIFLIYFILNMTTGFKPINTFISARNFNTMLMPDIFMSFKRYLFSISANSIEYLIYLGLSIGSLLILTIIGLLKNKKHHELLRYYLAFLLPMALLNLAGIYKTGQYSGETGRIWLFLTPLIIGGLKIEKKKTVLIAGFLSFAQTIIIQLAFNTFW